MTFLYPAFFYLFLLAVPVTLLYLFRLHRRRVRVSTLFFWEQILRDAETAALLHRLRKWLSLLCQLLLLSLMALAATRPMGTGHESARRRLVVLVDVSASMNAADVKGGRIEEAKSVGMSLVDSLGPADEMMLIAVDNAPHILLPFTDDPKLLRKALKTLSATQAPTEFTSALKLAFHVPSAGFKKEIYVISDGCFPPPDVPAPKGVSVFFAGVGKSGDNVGITTCEARALATSTRDYEVLLSLQNSSDKEVRTNIEIRLDEELVDVRPVVLSAHETRSETFTGMRIAGTRLAATLDAADDFPLDNRAYAVLPSIEPLKVLVVTEGNPFLEAALVSDDALAVTSCSLAGYGGPEGYDVTILDGCDPLSIGQGNFIFINSDMSALLGRGSRGVGEAVLTDWDASHALLRHVNLANVKLARCRRLSVKGDTVVARSFEDPLIFLGQRNGARYVSFAFDINESDLPLRTSFPILISNAVRLLGERSLLGYKPGLRTGSADAALLLAGRQGDVAAQKSGRFPEPSPAALPSPQAGFHALAERGAGKEVAVNLCDSHESSIRPRDRLLMGGVEALPFAVHSGLRFEPWFWLVALALALAVLEWVLYHRRVTE